MFCIIEEIMLQSAKQTSWRTSRSTNIYNRLLKGVKLTLWVRI